MKSNTNIPKNMDEAIKFKLIYFAHILMGRRRRNFPFFVKPADTAVCSILRYFAGGAFVAGSTKNGKLR